MKLSHVLPLAALGTAWITPDEHVFSDLAVESRKAGSALLDQAPTFDDIRHGLEDTLCSAKNAIDRAIDTVLKAETATPLDDPFTEKFDVEAWLSSSLFEDDGPHHPPHHGPPHHGPPHRGPPHRGPPHRGPPHKRPPHKEPHHPPHHGKPNATIYQLISNSKYTTKLAALVNEDKELVDILNGTKANYTLFAPTDAAFAKIPKHAPKPSKEFIRKVLLYHISEDFYPAGRLFHSHTIPTLFKEPGLGDSPQRLVRNVGLKGLTLNFYSHVVAVNIPAKNGVIHGVSAILLPPPPIAAIISFLPGEFSTLTLGLTKTGLLPQLNTTTHKGATFFAPSNLAFRKLGPKINAFLFSKPGEKYLKALLEYHVVLNHTLYDDAYYKPSSSEEKDNGNSDEEGLDGPRRRPQPPLAHVDLPTLFNGRSLSIDILRFGPFIKLKINGFATVAVPDGVAKDGVIHVVNNVIIPPKKLAVEGEDEEQDCFDADEMMFEQEELSVEEFKDRFDNAGIVEKEMKWDL